MLGLASSSRIYLSSIQFETILKHNPTIEVNEKISWRTYQLKILSPSGVKSS